MTTLAGWPSARRRAANSSAGHDPRGAPAGNRSNTLATMSADTSSIHLRLPTGTVVTVRLPPIGVDMHITAAPRGRSPVE